MTNYLIHEEEISEPMANHNGNRERENFFVSVVIPVFNEEQTIGDIVDRTKNTLENMGVSYEVLVVDDGSSDQSATVCKGKQANVLCCVHQGKGRALRSGFEAAKGNLVVTLDSDGSHQPEEIPKVLQPIMDGAADFVIGSRFLNSKANKKKIPKINRIGNRLFNIITGYITGTKISDSQSGFRAFRASLVKKMNLRSRGYEVESEMLVKALRMRARVTETPINFVQRTVGTSRLDPIQDGARILYAILASYVS
ncbi:MAG: glycosyltransferase family 2 protein [Candidatus Bathyarchaeia archaeon]